MRKRNIILRAVFSLGALTVLVGGVTYAALQSSATLTNNNISSATAGLQIDGPDADAVFGSSEAGLQFTGLVPGADYGDPQTFSLKNTGDAHLSVAVAATGGTPAGSFDASKVFVKVKNTTTNQESPEVSLNNFAALFNSLPGVSGSDTLAPAEENAFEVRLRSDADAATGTSASFTNFDLTFTGTAVAAPEEEPAP